MANQDSKQVVQLGKVEVREYNPLTDNQHLSQWLKAREMADNVTEQVPQVGLALLIDQTPVVFGFLRKVEGGFAMLDGLCTNPSIEANIRDLAIDILVNQLLNEGRKLNFTSVIAFSRDENTLERSIKHGFKQLPHSLICVDLKSKT